MGARGLADISELSFWLFEPRFLFRRLGLGLPHWGGAGGGVGTFPGGPPPVGAPTGPGRTRGCRELRFLTALQTSEQTSCVCLGGADDNGLKLQQKGSRLVFTKAFLRIANRWSRLPGAVPDSPAPAVLREPRGDGWCWESAWPAGMMPSPGSAGSRVDVSCPGAPPPPELSRGSGLGRGEQPCATCAGPAPRAAETLRSLK